MCAILGMAFLKGNKLDIEAIWTLRVLLRRLFRHSDSRGGDATGIAISSTKDLKVLRMAGDALKFCSSEEYNAVESTLDHEHTRSIIGHCRMQTQGTFNNNLNNHPIVCRDVVGVHNGIISNDNDIFNSYSVLTRRGQVDSEAIFALIEYYTTALSMNRAINRMSTEVRGNMAVAMLSRLHRDHLWLFRRNNPCTLMISRKLGVLFWASMKQHIETATNMHTKALGKLVEIDFPNNSGIEINLNKNTFYRFDVSEPNMLERQRCNYA